MVGFWRMTGATALLMLAVAGRADVGATQPVMTADGVSSIIGRLGNASFQTRESAEKELSGLGLDWRPMLMTARAATHDKEVSTRLGRAIDAINVRCAGDEPGITLHLKDATQPEVAAALAKELGLPLSARDNGARRYTVDADNQPYWDVYAALDKQGRLGIEYKAQERNLMPLELPARCKRVRGFMVGGKWAESGGPIETRVFPDPRLPVLSYAGPQVISVTDDAGAVIFSRKEAEGDEAQHPGSAWTTSWYGTTLVTVGPGRKIATVKAVSWVSVGVESDEKKLDDMSKHIGERMAVGDQLVVVAAMSTPPEGGFEMRLDASPANRSGDEKLVEFLVRDGTGTIVFSDWVRGGLITGVKGAGTKGPYSLEVKQWTKATDVRLEFELGG